MPHRLPSLSEHELFPLTFLDIPLLQEPYGLQGPLTTAGCDLQRYSQRLYGVYYDGFTARCGAGIGTIWTYCLVYRRPQTHVNPPSAEAAAGTHGHR